MSIVNVLQLRANTIADSLKSLDEDLKEKESISVCLAGADGTETATLQQVTDIVEATTDALTRADDVALSNFVVLLCGPNCRTYGEEIVDDTLYRMVLPSSEKNGVQMTVLTSHRCLHELRSVDDGMWGYPSWEASTLFLRELGVPCVVTGYNEVELSEDFEHFQDWTGTDQCEVAWAPKENSWKGVPRQGGVAPFLEMADSSYFFCITAREE